MLLVLSLCGLGLFLFRRRSRDPSLLYLSVFSLLYGLRLVFQQAILRSTLFDLSRVSWNWLILFLDCFTVLPFTLFLIQIIEPRWKKPLRWVLVYQAVFGVT